MLPPQCSEDNEAKEWAALSESTVYGTQLFDELIETTSKTLNGQITIIFLFTNKNIKERSDRSRAC